MMLASILFLVLAAPARAMFPPTSASQVGMSSVPRGTVSATQKGLGLSLGMRYMERTQLRSGTRDVANPDGERSRTLRTTLIIDRHVWGRFSAVVLLPHIRNESRSGGRTETVSGLGDATLLARASVLRLESITPKEVFLVAGAELPIGATRLKDSRGVQFPVPQQPGSGSLDWLLGAAAIWSFWDVSLYGDATWKRAGRKAYTFGDAVSLTAGLNYPLPFLPSTGVSAELNLDVAGRDRSEFGGSGVMPDGLVRDTGGDSLFVTTSLQWRPSKSVSLSAGVQIPAYQSLNGTQLKAGLSPHASVSTRFRAL